MTKSGLGHTVGLRVHFDSKQAEVFDSRGCDMNSPHQRQIRRGYYSKQALDEFNFCLFVVCSLQTRIHMPAHGPKVPLLAASGGRMQTWDVSVLFPQDKVSQGLVTHAVSQSKGIYQTGLS